MDEIDRLTEQPEESTRRAINTVAFEFHVPANKAQDNMRDGLLEALRVDAELSELHLSDHPKVLGLAVDPPETSAADVLYRVHIDFAPGEVDLERVREIIHGNLEAELVASA